VGFPLILFVREETKIYIFSLHYAYLGIYILFLFISIFTQKI
jgi:hypothetical protein